jgi:hypothetical protein
MSVSRHSWERMDEAKAAAVRANIRTAAADDGYGNPHYVVRLKTRNAWSIRGAQQIGGYVIRIKITEGA